MVPRFLACISLLCLGPLAVDASILPKGLLLEYLMGTRSTKLLALRDSEPVVAVTATPSVVAGSVTVDPNINISVTVKECPSIWITITNDLKQNITGCNNLAKSALRFAFHDAAGYTNLTTPYGPATGGADGSLLLSDVEASRIGNAPLNDFRTSYLLPKYNQYKANVSAADFVQIAGSLGTQSCLGGTIYQTVVGRTDTAQPAPDGTLPQAFGPGSDYDSLITLWAQKGFNAQELAALLGAHSTSRAFAQQAHGIPSGGPQDSTPEIWDLAYYSQTQAATAPAGVYRFDSDVNLAQANTSTGAFFTLFSADLVGWTVSFAEAMYKLSVLGIPAEIAGNFADCTAVVTL